MRVLLFWGGVPLFRDCPICLPPGPNPTSVFLFVRELVGWWFQGKSAGTQMWRSPSKGSLKWTCGSCFIRTNLKPCFTKPKQPSSFLCSFPRGFSSMHMLIIIFRFRTKPSALKDSHPNDPKCPPPPKQTDEPESKPLG